MKCNEAGRAIIEGREGCELESYPDPGSALGRACAVRGLLMRDYRKVAGWEEIQGNPWTIGYGSTRGVHQGMRITQAEADSRLESDLADTESAVSAAAPIRLNENQFSALVCFAYNVKDWRETPLFRLVLEGDLSAAADHWELYCKAGGHVKNGLVIRRRLEKALFLTPPTAPGSAVAVGVQEV